MKNLFNNVKTLFSATLLCFCLGILTMSFQVPTQAQDQLENQAYSCPTAGFSANTSGLTISFTNQSSGGLSYLWDFGDGNTSSAANPVHTYAEARSYEVKLTVYGATCQASEIVIVEVNDI